jgi:hypothetical protein
MAITGLTLARMGGLAWRAAFTSSLASPTFRVWIDGVRVGTTSIGRWDFTVRPGDGAAVEVYDAAADEPREPLPARLTVQWRAVTGAASYRVEEYGGAAWAVRASVTDDGRGYYQWASRRLEDDTTHQFRVVAVGGNGNEATAAQVDALMVRRPDVPTLTLAWDAEAGAIVIAEG